MGMKDCEFTDASDLLPLHRPAKEQSRSSRGLGVWGGLGSCGLARGGSSPGSGHGGGCRFPRSSSAVDRNVGAVPSPNVELTDRVVAVVEA
ncbi:hypothetical protein TIFTF001_027191 [Ficus carica]|uniref:Uncharacterized protein n=1 Tax=Ficus carica TaxID=3494 RepID=A0AA88DMM0_FICCA|nr:hypothetical protein TIFTF001_027191 [Ficus carica]